MIGEPSQMWWTFQLPIPKGIVDVKAHVPGLSEKHARLRLAATCYDGAPVESWPCLGAAEAHTGRARRKESR